LNFVHGETESVQGELQMEITRDELRKLDEDGYLVLPGLMSGELLAALRSRVEELFAQEGNRAGDEFKQEPGCRRLANLVNKGAVFHEVFSRPELLACVAHLIGPDFKLSSLNARSANPFSVESQPLHSDMGAVADERGYWVANSVWLLDDFTLDNGATRVVPGTHRLGKLPQQMMTDLYASHPEERLLTGRAGSVFIYNAHMWHGGTANRTPLPRRALHAFYVRRDKPQQQYQKKLLSDDVQHSLSPALRHLLALDDPLNDELCRGDYVRSGFLK
jgi:ectoine hydroxylase-related dioxygenase (phytanoyl-CoA dioxygenase family)